MYGQSNAKGLGCFVQLPWIVFSHMTDMKVRLSSDAGLDDRTEAEHDAPGSVWKWVV